MGWGEQRRAGGKNGAGGRKTDGLWTRSRVREREKGRDKGRDADKEAMTGGKREGQAMGGGYYGCGKERKSCSKWRKVLFSWGGGAQLDSEDQIRKTCCFYGLQATCEAHS